MTAGEFEGGITPQIIQVIGIFVAAGNSQYASPQDVGKRMNNPRRVAPIGYLLCTPVGDPDAPLRQSQQHHATVGTDAATIECGGDLLAGVPMAVRTASGYRRSWRVWQRPTR